MLQYGVASLCNQLLSEYSGNQFETLHRCYKHIEDVHVTFCTQKYNFDKVTAILTMTFQALVSDIDCLWWRVMGGDGERGKAWLRAGGASSVSYRHNFLFFVGGGSRGTGLLLCGNIGK